jgi:hypothetical protein
MILREMESPNQVLKSLAACESEKGPLRSDRILSKQKNRRDEIGNANDGLNNRNKDVKTSSANMRERQNYSEQDRQENNNADRSPALLGAGGHARN